MALRGISILLPKCSERTSDNFRYLTLVPRDWWWWCSDWTCEGFSFYPHWGLNWGLDYLLFIIIIFIIIIIIIIIIYYYWWGWFLSLIFQVFAFYHVLSSVIPTPWTHMVLDALPCYLIWLIDSTFLRICAVPRIADLCRL